jgi:hypothetical protein
MVLHIVLRGTDMLINGQIKRYPQILKAIKEGADIYAVNEHGEESTALLLTRLAFRDHLICFRGDLIANFISQEIDEEVLYSVIRAGGIENFMLRRANGFYQKANKC